MQGLMLCVKLFVVATILLTFRSTVAKAQRGDDASRWVQLSNTGGWTIRHPASIRVGSCRQCPSPPSANLVTFRDPATGGTIMIENLADKPVSQSADTWLEATSRDTIGNSRASEEWTFLDGQLALRVRNRNPDSTESENVYVVEGQKTFAIRVASNKDPTFYSLYQQMLSTFRVTVSANSGQRPPGKPGLNKM